MTDSTDSWRSSSVWPWAGASGLPRLPRCAGVGVSTAYRLLAAGRACDPRFAAIVVLRRKPEPTPWDSIGSIFDDLSKSKGKGALLRVETPSKTVEKRAICPETKRHGFLFG